MGQHEMDDAHPNRRLRHLPRARQGARRIRRHLVRERGLGEEHVGVPGDGNFGVLQAGAVEESNVDLTAELVNMITAQRSYQANAQTIKTQDQILQTIVNLR